MKNLYALKNGITTLALVLSFGLYAQNAEFVDGGLTYTQDFNTLANTYNSDINTWANGTDPLLGWYSYVGIQSATPASGAASTQYATGGNNTGTGLDFGIAGKPNSWGYNADPLVDNTERSLGFRLALANNDAALMLMIKNNTTSNINKIVVTYTGEQWSAVALNSQKFYFSYKIDATASNPNDDAATYTGVAALDFTSLQVGTTGSVTNMLDGNLDANRTVGITAAFNVALPIGSTITLKWLKGNGDAGNDHSLAIDDLTVTATQGTLAVSDFNESQVVFYVNSGLLNFSAKTELSSISIYAVTGALVKQETINSASTGNVSINSLQNGVYIAKVTGKNGESFTGKFVK
jgi:hypothetical protein